MRALKSFAFGVAVYAIVSTLIFGDVILAPRLLLTWYDRLGLPGWRLGVCAMIAFLAFAFFGPLNRYVHSPFRFPAFVLASILIPTTCIVLIADWQRRQAIADFAPDYVIQNSLFTSLREAPEDHQFYLHAAALKDCNPYAWSYRTMEFYFLHQDVSVNVIPQDWVDMCGITRSQR